MGQALPPPRTPPVYVTGPPARRESVPMLSGRARHVVLVELAVMGFALAAPSLVLGLQGLGHATQIKTQITYLDLVALILSALAPAVLCVFLLWRDGVLTQTMFAHRSAGFAAGWGAVTFAAMFGAAIVGGVVISALKSLAGSHAVSNVRAQNELTGRYALVAIGLSLAAGIAEEAVWRAYGAARLEQAGYPRLALVGPSGVWVLLHLYGGPYTVLGVAFLGAPLVWMAWWKRSVWPLMVAHVAWDLLAFLAAAVHTNGALVEPLLRR